MKRCTDCEFRCDGPAWLCPACGAGSMSANGFVTFAPDLDHNAEVLSSVAAQLPQLCLSGSEVYSARLRYAVPRVRFYDRADHIVRLAADAPANRVAAAEGARREELDALDEWRRMRSSVRS